MRKQTIWVSDQVQHKPACIVTDACYGLKKKRVCTICVVKTKALISCAIAITAQLICILVSLMQIVGFLVWWLNYVFTLCQRKGMISCVITEQSICTAGLYNPFPSSVFFLLRLYRPVCVGPLMWLETLKTSFLIRCIS